ncbi:MAG: CCA tRNA nucleotidyltransferase [Clostridia bacterium]|nr:CCA tRNA nucleotidyltransferase [Clostridia bacterium]
MKIEIPERVQSIIDTLVENGYEAYAVGGCVRDSLIGRTPNDWDITTSAKPFEVKSLFKKTIDVGIEHGTVTVMLDNVGYEVTTYRIDGDYIDNRHPEEVQFTKDINEDLARRDFTINAMAYNETNGLIDPYDGAKDLDKKLIRCVGNPSERYNEDALRMLRAIRFSAQLGFDIEKETYNAIKNNSHLIKNISVERIRDEITKIIMSDNPEKFLVLYDTGLLELIMPEFIPNINCPQNSPWHKYTVDEHILRALMNIENRFDLRWTMLLHDIGKAKCRYRDEKGIDHFWHHPEEGAILAEDILRRFNFDSFNLNKIVRLIRYHDIDMAVDGPKLRKTINIVGIDIFEDLITVMNADDSAKAEVVWIENREKYDAIKQSFEMFIENKYCLRKKDLAINGDDLIDLGYEQNSSLGKAINYLFDKVLETPSLNTSDSLKELASQYLKTIKDNTELEEFEFVILASDEDYNHDESYLEDKEN